MSDKADSLNFLYSWEEKEAGQSPLGDTSSITSSRLGDIGTGNIEHAKEQNISNPPLDRLEQASDGTSSSKEGIESFQWSKDREEAIEAALESTPQGTYPQVHKQIKSILAALEANTISASKASLLLEEVGAYLSLRIAGQKSKVDIENEVFQETREDKINALFSWQEAYRAALEYTVSKDPMQLKIANYAADQACGLLDQSLESLLAIEPEVDTKNGG